MKKQTEHEPQRTITIGDVHGDSYWELIADVGKLIKSKRKLTPKYDFYIFTGDYVDSFTVSDKDIIRNLEEIIKFKLKYPNHVVLLIGNHDVQYMFRENQHLLCSGYRQSIRPTLYEIFNKYSDLFQLSFGIANTLWSHAGIHHVWAEKHLCIDLYANRDPRKDIDFNERTVGNKAELAANKLNEDFDNDKPYIYDVGYMRGGMEDVGGPLWCDKTKLYKNPMRGIDQVVGHSAVPHIMSYSVNGNMLHFVDTMGNWNSYEPVKYEKLRRALTLNVDYNYG